MNPLNITKNYPWLSHKIAKRIEVEEKWSRLVPYIQAKIISAALSNFELWSQLTEYTSSLKAKSILIPEEKPLKTDTNGHPYSQREEEEEIFEVVDDYKATQKDCFTESLLTQQEQNLTLDDLIISARNTVRRVIFERLLFKNSEKNTSEFDNLNKNSHATQEDSTSQNKFNKSNTQLNKVATRFQIAEDYDSDQSFESSKNQLEEVCLDSEKKDLVSELSGLDFGYRDEGPLELDISDMYYDLTPNQTVVEEHVRIQHYLEQLEMKSLQLKELVASKKASKAESGVSSPRKSTTVPRLEEPPSSPLFENNEGPLKFLLGFLDEQKDSLPISKYELRGLIDEIQGEDAAPSYVHVRSRLGFNESLERVIHELIDLKDHSFPFLSPVNKKMAPDYHKKIQNPMDLSTVSKKVRTNKYSTKEEFAADLNLIYSNCRAYNTSKGNELISHVKAMEERTKILLQTVPDNGLKLTPEILDRSANNTPKKPPLALPELNSSPFIKDFDLDFGPQTHDISQGEEDVFLFEEKGSDESDTLLASRLHSEIKRIEYIIQDPPSKYADVETVRSNIWKNLTRETRAMNRLMSFPIDTLDFGACPAITFYNNKVDNSPLCTLSNQLHPSGSCFEPAKRQKLSNECILKRFPELSMTGTLPGISQKHGDYLLRYPIPNSHTLSSFAALKVPQASASVDFLKNIEALKATRDVSNKIFTTKDFLEDTGSARSAEELKHAIRCLSIKPRIPCEAYKSFLPRENDINTIPTLNNQTARASMLRTGSLLLQHAGFDSSESHALEVFTNLLTDHLQSLGQTMRLYMDNHSELMSHEDIMLHTLYENKIYGINDLQEYLNDNIKRHGCRIREIHAKLQDRFDNLIAQSTGCMVTEEGDFDLEEGLDGMMAGNFEELTGDDFFGFKDLGLDKELGITSLSVPVRLLLGHKRKALMAPSIGGALAQPLEYPPPPPFSPIYDASQPIGLLKSFFQEKLKDGSEKLIEDEFLPPRKPIRPKIPPVGKYIGIQRRRQAEQAALNLAKRHKRALETEQRKRLKAEKQQEKETRIKERKAMRQARMQAREEAKAQRKRIREEQLIARRAEADLRRSSKSNTNSATPAAISPDEESLKHSSSPISSPRSASLSSSPTSSTTSSDDEDHILAASRSRANRKPIPRRDTGRKSSRPIAPIRSHPSNGLSAYPILSSTSEGSFSGSVSISEDDDDDEDDEINPQQSRYRTKNPRWPMNVSTTNQRTSASTPSIPSINNKPRKKPLRPTNSLASPITRNLKRKGPQK